MTSRSQSMGELDRLLELRRKLKAQLKDGACRKSSSEVLMVKSAEKSPKYNPAGGMDGTRQCGTFIDWRGLPIAHAAALALGLTPLNLVVWAKTNAGMGSLYRSQHELLPLFKKGIASHINNVSLGKRGRHRTNLWIYPGASSVASDAHKGLQHHPTVKPTAMLQDALIDLTNRSEIVLDPFLGSGS